MIVLIIRTDKPEAEIGLYDGQTQLAYTKWEGHRQLSTTIHSKIEALLKEKEKSWQDINGIVCYRGPGSFTGLRIGLTVANTVSTTLEIPIVGSNGADWIQDGINRLLDHGDDKIVLPEYGQEAHITKQKR